MPEINFQVLRKIVFFFFQVVLEFFQLSKLPFYFSPVSSPLLTTTFPLTQIVNNAILQISNVCSSMLLCPVFQRGM